MHFIYLYFAFYHTVFHNESGNKNIYITYIYITFKKLKIQHITIFFFPEKSSYSVTAKLKLLNGLWSFGLICLIMLIMVIFANKNINDNKKINRMIHYLLTFQKVYSFLGLTAEVVCPLDGEISFTSTPLEK